MRFVLFAVALVAGDLAVGCKPSAGLAADPDAGARAGAAASAQVLARVGDRTITLGDYLAALDHLDQFDRLRYSAPDRRRALLDDMIDVMLLADEARARGYDREPATEEQVREILRDAMLKKAREGAPTPNQVPADEVRAYFDAHRADFHDPERRRLSAIVLASEAAAAPTLQAALRASPTEWGELVRSRSIDSASATADTPPDLAGDFGFVSPPGDPRGENSRVPPEVRAALFEVSKVGDVLPRVVMGAGRAWIVRLGSKTGSRDQSLEDVSRSIRVKLAQEKAHAREVAMLDELRNQITVQIDEAELAEVRVDAGRAEP